LARNSALLCEVTKVEGSSQIKRYAYNPDLRILIVGFMTGGLYLYKDVPFEKIEGMRDAESVGSYFSREIKDNHRCVNLNFIPDWYTT